MEEDQEDEVPATTKFTFESIASGVETFETTHEWHSDYMTSTLEEDVSFASEMSDYSIPPFTVFVII